MEFDEKYLTSELSSKAVHQCIIELTSQSENAVRCWGKHETKRLVLKLEDGYLKLLDPISSAVLTSQLISSIRVWGVNAKSDFAFVARDNIAKNCTKNSDQVSESNIGVLKCHVFHCENCDGNENSAQKIVNLLKDEMIRIKSKENTDSFSVKRPKNLSFDDIESDFNSSPDLEFPIPIEEPRKTLIARYLGKTPVSKPVGMDALNDAINKVITELNASPRHSSPNSENSRGCVALVHVSPSKVSVESTVNGQILFDCRVRYLSFLGISRSDVKCCAFIIQADEASYEAYCFECEPSAGALCKTIEAACMLRYQKCLDAHRQRSNSILSESKKSKSSLLPKSPSISAIKTSLVNAFSKLLPKGSS